MDVQKTMEFLLEQQAQFQVAQAQIQATQAQMQTTQAQIQLAQVRQQEDLHALTLVVDNLADRVTKLDEVMEVLAQASIETQRRFQETDVRFDKLVSAIGEFMRKDRNGDTRPQ